MVLVSKWCDKNASIGVESKYKKLLTVMALNRFMGYDFDEINSLNQGGLSQERYELNSKNIINCYIIMTGDLSQSLLPLSKHFIPSQQINNYYPGDGDFESYAADWYDCNPVDRMDGSKYIGYTRREYEDSRYGSFPIHDDYGEESWADDEPWE